jgi:nitric oxide reductase activation protein
VKVGDLVMVREDRRRPQDENSIGLLYKDRHQVLMILWNDDEPEDLDHYSDELEVISESR